MLVNRNGTIHGESVLTREVPAVASVERSDEGLAGKAKLAVLAALSFSYFLFLLGLLACAATFFILLVAAIPKSANPLFVAALGLPLLALSYAANRSIWLELPRPSGPRLDRDQAGPLFDELERLYRLSGARPVRGIVMSDEFGASVVPVGRVGPMGSDESCLVIGMPLMQALTPEQFRVVLLRELAHRSGAGDRFGAWLYNLRKDWLYLRDRLGKSDEFALFPGRSFARLYTWLLERWSVGFVRKRELVADRLAAKLGGAETTAEALVCLSVGGAFLTEELWPSIYKRADEQEEPPEDAYDRLAQGFRRGPEKSQAQRWLNQDLLRHVNAADERPGLAERLAALGHEVGVPGTLTRSAADHFLTAAAYSELKQQLNESWRLAIRESWLHWHSYVKQAQARFSEGAATEAQAMELWQRACYVEEFEGPEAALPLYHAFAAQHPNHPGVHFALGRLLLPEEQAQGLSLLLKAMRLDVEYVPRGSELIDRFLLAIDKQEPHALGRVGAAGPASDLNAAQPDLEPEGHEVAPEQEPLRERAAAG